MARSQASDQQPPVQQQQQQQQQPEQQVDLSQVQASEQGPAVEPEVQPQPEQPNPQQPSDVPTEGEVADAEATIAAAEEERDPYDTSKMTDEELEAHEERVKEIHGVQPEVHFMRLYDMVAEFEERIHGLERLLSGGRRVAGEMMNMVMGSGSGIVTASDTPVVHRNVMQSTNPPEPQHPDVPHQHLGETMRRFHPIDPLATPPAPTPAHPELQTPEGTAVGSSMRSFNPLPTRNG